MRILTFDIEDWFHILDNVSTKTEKEWAKFPSRLHANSDRILGLLEERNLKATFFCLGWIAGKYPDIVKRISGAGHEIASHSYMHQLVYDQDRKAFTEDLKRSIGELEDIIGQKILAYRAPGFSIRKSEKWAIQTLIEHGIKIDSSIFPTKRGHGGYVGFPSRKPCLISLNGAVIKEFPVSTYRFLGSDIVYAGGGYFRLFPYAAIKRMAIGSDYTMTYFHPRDFDPQQPIVAGLSLLRKFKSYYGLQAAFEKLKFLLSDFSFKSIGEADRSIAWEKTEVIKL